MVRPGPAVPTYEFGNGSTIQAREALEAVRAMTSVAQARYRHLMTQPRAAREKATR